MRWARLMAPRRLALGGLAVAVVAVTIGVLVTDDDGPQRTPGDRPAGDVAPSPPEREASPEDADTPVSTTFAPPGDTSGRSPVTLPGDPPPPPGEPRAGGLQPPMTPPPTAPAAGPPEQVEPPRP